MKIIPFRKILKREKKEKKIEENMYKLLQEKEIILKALESNREKFPEFKDIHEVVLHKDRQWNLRQLLKNIDKLKQLNRRMRVLEDEFLRFEGRDIEAIKHLDILLVDSEDEFKKLVKFHDKKIKLSGKHKRLLQNTRFKDNIYEKERTALVNLLYVMQYVHNDILKLRKIMEKELRVLKKNSKIFEKLRQASKGKINRIDNEFRFGVIFAIRELMQLVDDEIDIVRRLRNHFKIEEGKLGVVKELERDRVELEAA